MAQSPTGETTTTDIKDSILDTVGDTPLVRLSRIGAGPARRRSSPRSSTSTRAARSRTASRCALVEAAERDGRLQPGGTIIEPTSGNTGTGLAIAARIKGYRVIAVMPDKMSQARRSTCCAPTAPRSSSRRPTSSPSRRSPTTASPTASRRRSRAPSSPTSTPTRPTRRRTTRRPARSCGARPAAQITHLVVGVGTGGTITGVGALPEASRTRRSRSSAPTRSARSTPTRRSTRTSSRASARTSGRRPTTRGRRPLRDASPTATRSSPRAGWPRPRGCSSAARAGSRCTPRSRSAAEHRRPGGDGRRDPARRRPRLPEQDLQRRLDGPVRVPGAHRRAHGRRRAAREDGGGRDPAVRGRADRPAGARRDRAAARAPRLQLPVVSSHDPSTIVGSVGERGLLKRAVDDPQLMGAHIVDVMEPPFPNVVRRPTRCARRSSCCRATGQALHGDRERPAGGDRHPRRPARVAGLSVSETRASPPASCTRASSPDPSYGGVVPAIHQASTYVQPAPGEFVGDYDYSRSANPTRTRAGERRSASSRAGARARSPPAWPRRTRC